MILEKYISSKRYRYFDEYSKKDLEVARDFFLNKSWGAKGCPFILEFPYTSVPGMMKDKLLNKSLGIKRNSALTVKDFL